LSTLYLRLPPKADVDGAQGGAPLYCQFASVSSGDAIEREGVAALSEMSQLVSRAQRVCLLLAAGDVTLLRVKVPPMSAGKLRAALPNLVEDQLMSDPSECVVVAGDAADDGLRTVAVVHRGWLEILSKTLMALGARRVTAVPSQLCLPLQDAGASAAVTEHGAQVEVAVRLAAQDGIGLPVFAEQPEVAPAEAMQALSAVTSNMPVALYVPQSRMRAYEDALGGIPAAKERITLYPDSWQRWIAGANAASIDLMAGLGMAAGPSLNWRPWRAPLVLIVALALVQVAGLNIDWLRKKREADALRDTMVRIYKSAYPKDTVIIDPLAQMRQKIAVAQRESGQIAPNDFLALAAAFGEAWVGAGQGAQTVAGLEYRDRSLAVKLKPGTSPPLERLKTALAARDLSIAQAGNGVLQIRSAK
jgi:general secretion pathway protein L